MSFNSGQPWTKVQTANGLAFGTNGAANTYDDSYAYLSGFVPNQQGEAVVYVDPNLTGGPHEVEMILRWADSAQSARGYECLFNYQGAWKSFDGMARLVTSRCFLGAGRAPLVATWSVAMSWRKRHRKHDHRFHQRHTALYGKRLDVGQWATWNRILQAHDRPEFRLRHYELLRNVPIAPVVAIMVSMPVRLGVRYAGWSIGTGWGRGSTIHRLSFRPAIWALDED